MIERSVKRCVDQRNSVHIAPECAENVVLFLFIISKAHPIFSDNLLRSTGLAEAIRWAIHKKTEEYRRNNAMVHHVCRALVPFNFVRFIYFFGFWRRGAVTVSVCFLRREREKAYFFFIFGSSFYTTFLSLSHFLH